MCVRQVGLLLVLMAGFVSSCLVSVAVVPRERGVLYLRAGRVPPGEAMPSVPEPGAATADNELFLVFLDARRSAETRKALANTGALILAYLPNDTYALRFDPGRTPHLLDLEGVTRIEPFHPWYRLDTNLQEWILSEGDPETRRLRIVIFEWGAQAKQPVVDEAQRTGTHVYPVAPNGQVIEVEANRKQLLDLARLPETAWIDAWTPTATDMDLTRESSGANWLDSLEGFCGQGVRGEVFDSGFEETHQDFGGVMLHGPHDLMNHGTSTYGIVFGDGSGDAKALGMLPCAEQGIFADKDEVTDRYAHTKELLSYPYLASFQTNSWGHTRSTGYTSYSHEMDDITWRLDLPIVQSQSNSGSQLSRPEAWAKNVISVGGIRHANTLTEADDQWSGGTSIGPAEDGRIKPDLCYWSDHIYTTTTGGYRPDFDGTSSATPQVAGVLGLIMELWSENAWNTNPVGETVFERRPHAATAKALLISSTQQYEFSGTDHDLTRMHQGWGRPNARLAKQRAARSLVVDQAVQLTLNESAHYEVEVEPGESELRVVMVYPDPPGTLSASMHRINDLDLSVRSPAGVLYHGNHGLGEGTNSVSGGSSDTLNTVEVVRVADPPAGLWQIEILAAEINQDGELATTEEDASFALVVTGAIGTETCAGGDAPSNLVATTPADNRVELSWQPSPDATEYRVYRSSESCDVEFEYVGSTMSESFVDDPVSGGSSKFYKVRAVNACGGVSEASECTVITPGGECIDPPRFAGLEQARDLRLTSCTIELTWNPAQARCGTETRYNVYRSTLDDFSPSPANLVASCLESVAWSDTAVDDGTRYNYVVRAEDPSGSGGGLCAGGFEDGNVVRRNATPSGPDDVFFSDLFESNSGWSLEGEFEIGAPQGLGGSLLGGPDPAVAAEGMGVLGLDLSGQGDYAGNYEREISVLATSPSFDTSGHSAVFLRFWRWLGVEESTSDLATIEVFDGNQWLEIWRNPPITISDKSWALDTFDVTSQLAGVSNARIRFGMQSSFNRHFCGWNVDQLEFYEPRSCESPAPTPPPVPDGRFAPGTPMNSGKSATESEKVDLTWDVTSCPSPSYHLFFGSSTSLAAYAYDGAACDLSTSGSDTVAIPAPSPGSFTWWLIAGADGATEGGHGFSSDGLLRSATGIPFCGLNAREVHGTCP